MNIIDALVVKFTADNKDLNRGFDESTERVDEFGKQATKESKRVQQQTKDMARGFRNVRTEISGLLGISLGAGGIGALIGKTVGGQAELGRLSKNLNMSARDLDAWGRVMGQVGGNIDDARNSMQALATAAEQRSLGIQSDAVGVLYNMGINLTDAEGNRRAPAQILQDIARSQQFQDASAQRQLTIGDRLGISRSMIYLMRQGPQAMQAQLAEARRNSNVTQGSVRQSQRTQKALNELNQSLMGAWQTIYISLGPALESLNVYLKQFGDWLSNNKGEIQSFFTSVVEGFGDLVSSFRAYNEETDGMAGNILKVVAALATFKAAISALKAALAIASGGLLGKVLSGSAGRGAVGRGGLGKRLLKTLPFIGTGLVLWNEFGDDLMQSTPMQNARNRVQSTGSRGSGGSQNDIISYFMSRGWSRAQAIGIAANLQQESNFNPKAVGDSGQAHGIAQWHPARRKEFRRVFGKRMLDASLQEQMAFVHYEMTKGKEMAAGNSLMGAKTAGEAAMIVSKEYERPADKWGEAFERAGVARSMARQFRVRGSSPRQQTYLQSLMFGAGTSPGITNNSNRANSTTTNDVSIGEVTVQTQATDANGIARDLRGSFRSHPLLNFSAQGQM